MKRIIAILLCLCMAADWLPMGTAASEESEPATIEEQIRAFADSIDKPNADDDAAWALASHGMFQGGKKLSVGKSHALTATLLNSEMMQALLIGSCETAVRNMRQLDALKLENVSGSCYWSGGTDDSFYMRVYDSADPETRMHDWYLSAVWDYTGKRNGYDESLEWIAGGTEVSLEVTRSKVTADTMTYQVSVTVRDRFDFATSGNSLFKDLISGIGALFFKEFDWESKVSFDLQVPNECSHGPSAYHWIHDPDSKIINSDTSGSWKKNEATRQTDDTASYYELENTVRLLHDMPWVMEYDVPKSGTVVLAPLENMTTSRPMVYAWSGHLLSVFARDKVNVSQQVREEYGLSSAVQYVYRFYGTPRRGLDGLAAADLCTVRLENRLNADGTNMVYLTIYNTATGAVLMDGVPMDDYYLYEPWAGNNICQSQHNDWFSGKDLHISYIGNSNYRFETKYFDLRIWENGADGESAGYYEKSNVTAPTCTKRGYTTYTCFACGHSKKADYVDATGHSWGEWEVISETQRQHTCTVCGEVEQEEISILYGDANGDGSVNALDLILLRQYLAGWDVTVGTAADANGDGTANALDLILLRQYLAGWDVTLGPKE